MTKDIVTNPQGKVFSIPNDFHNDPQWIKRAVDYIQKTPEITTLNFHDLQDSTKITARALQALLEKQMPNITTLIIPLSNRSEIQELANSQAFPNLTTLRLYEEIDINPAVTSYMQASTLFLHKLTHLSVQLGKSVDSVNVVSGILKVCPNLQLLDISGPGPEQSKKLADYCLKEQETRVKSGNDLFCGLMKIYKNNPTGVLDKKDVEQLVGSCQYIDIEFIEYLIKTPNEFPGIENSVQKLIKDHEIQIENLERQVEDLQSSIMYSNKRKQALSKVLQVGSSKNNTTLQEQAQQIGGGLISDSSILPKPAQSSKPPGSNRLTKGAVIQK